MWKPWRRRPRPEDLKVWVLESGMVPGESEELPPPGDNMVWFQAYVSLEALNPVTVDALKLVDEKKGRYLPQNWGPTQVEDFHTQYYYFEIPTSHKQGKRKGRLVASTADANYRSGEFYISW